MSAGGGERTERAQYEIEFLPAAARQLAKLPLAGQALVVDAIDGLISSPRPAGAKLLSGTSDERIWRLAVADYRVLYQITDNVLLVVIVRVADRRDVYSPMLWLDELGLLPPGCSVAALPFSQLGIHHWLAQQT